MKTGRIEGLDKDITRLVLGCDNKMTTARGRDLWNAFVDCGGTAFDTGHVYGGGACERALGGWIRENGNEDRIVLIAKGAHTPHCDPDSLIAQLHESLDRLRVSAADIYIMHRDNQDVPVGEFVDVLNAQVDAGLISVFGGSNWSIERFQAANAYARRRQTRPFRILNNNLSLARMEKPVWDGCISASDPSSLDFLEASQTAHFAWSSQARGYFHAPERTTALPDGTGPEACFDSADNRERRRRAGALGERLGAAASHVATAYVLGQPFPSFALIGPRTIAELDDSRTGQDLDLSPSALAWLDLRRDEPPW